MPDLLRRLLQAVSARLWKGPHAEVLSLVDRKAHPYFSPLAVKTKNLDVMMLNIKFFGYELARQFADALPVRDNLSAQHVGLKSKPSTQSDLESDWVAYWCGELKIPMIFHRKLWEFAFVLQAIYENGFLKPGCRGLGFGCGQEPLPSYLAAHDLSITVTDLPPQEARTAGWRDSGQHASSLEQVFKSDLVDSERFHRNVALSYLDMNDTPATFTNYDFCWSICALEHLGSIEKGQVFIKNSLQTLRPGGLAVHTTEFNFFNDDETIDNWLTVLFQRRHFKEIAAQLRQEGHFVAELDFDVGHKPLDQFIDIPPFSHEWSDDQRRSLGEKFGHIKLAIEGFATTCFGIIVKKAG